MKKVAAVRTILGLLLLAAPVGAQAPNRIVSEISVADGVTVSVPQAALDGSPVIIPLGTAVDPQSGRVVEGLAIIHYRNNFSHKPNHPDKGGKPGGDSASTCFSYLAKGAEWKVFGEDYIVDASNNGGLSEANVRSIIADGITQWEDAADGTIDGSIVDIFGDEDLTSTVNRAAIGTLDGRNDVIFGSIAEANAIAVTYVWGIFSGPPRGRELVEWNMIYDDVDFDWSDTGEAFKMDFENIFVHEMGHAFGLGHPDNTCTDESMYAFAGFGEINKRDLNAGDIAGIDGLY